METTPSTAEKIKAIKQSFRLYMNGVTARSLRDKGCSYKVVWGVALNHLHDIAAQYEPDYDLAVGLWSADVRECKLLATLLMPPKSMTLATSEQWMEQASTEELAEMLVFNLLQHCDFAPQLANDWLSSSSELAQLSAFNLFARLFMKRHTLSDNESQVFISHAVAALQSHNQSIRRAAMNSLIRFAQLNDESAKRAKDATLKLGFDFL